MLTRKTSEAIQKELGGWHPSNTLVAVCRDFARREWTCYCLEEGGRFFHFNPVCRDGEETILAGLLKRAAGESDGIDPAALLDDGEYSAAEEICPVPSGTTTTTAGDVLYSQMMRHFMLGPGFGGSPEPEGATRMMVGYDPGVSDVTAHAVVYFPPRHGKTAALRQSAAMQGLASVMGQVEGVLLRMWQEDEQFSRRGRDGADSVNLYAMNQGGMARAASRWSERVKRAVKEREEAARMNVAIRVQGEED